VTLFDSCDVSDLCNRLKERTVNDIKVNEGNGLRMKEETYAYKP